MFKLSKESSFITKYSIGLIFSIILTVLAFLSINWGFSTTISVIILIIFALSQLLVQIVFFLHLNKEPYPKWNLLAFLMACWFVVAIVIGSIWIMSNLDYNMMPREVEHKLIEDEGYNL